MVEVKRYWVLAWDKYYPNARLEDVRGTFEDYEDAEAFANNLYLKYDYQEIIDMETHHLP